MDTITMTLTHKIEPRVCRTWLSGTHGKYRGKTILLPIPTAYAQEYHLDQPTSIILIPKDDGILIKKLEAPK